MFLDSNNTYGKALYTPHDNNHDTCVFDWNPVISPEPLHKTFFNTATRFPHHMAIDFWGKEYSYEELAHLIDKTAAGFQQLGVVKGMKIGLLLENTPYYIICFFAALKAGATVVNLSSDITLDELRYRILDSDTDVLVTLDKASIYNNVERVLGETHLKMAIMCPMKDILPWPKSLFYPIVHHHEIAHYPLDQWHISYAELINNNGHFMPVDIDAKKDIALVQYDYSATNLEKGIMFTHANLYIDAKECICIFNHGLDGFERVLVTSRFDTLHGLTTAINMTTMRGFQIIIPMSIDMPDTLSIIEQKRPTMIIGNSQFYNQLVSDDKIHNYDLTSVCFAIANSTETATRISHQTKQKFMDITNGTLVETFCITEAGGIVATTLPRSFTKAGSIGKPMPATKVSIVDIENPFVVLPEREIGRIAISGQKIMCGYYHDAISTRQSKINKKVVTDYIGYMDYDGYIYIEGQRNTT